MLHSFGVSGLHVDASALLVSPSPYFFLCFSGQKSNRGRKAIVATYVCPNPPIFTSALKRDT